MSSTTESKGDGTKINIEKSKTERQSKINIGVDLGATYTKIGLVSGDKIISSLSFKTPKFDHAIALEISKNIKKLTTENAVSFCDIGGIGIGCAGPITRNDGIVTSLTNLKMTNFDFAGAIKRNLKDLDIAGDISIKLINDADAATLAEYHFGVGKGHENMVMLTIGTGVGGGIIIGGKLYQGCSAAAEFGHMIIQPNGRKCGCGARGCLEAYASITSLIKTANKLRKKDSSCALNKFDVLNGKIIFECCKLGDDAATDAVNELTYYLSLGIINIVNILRPSLIVIGGGVSAQKDYLINLISNQITKNDYFLTKAAIPKLECASVCNDAGIIGAALLHNN